MPDPTSLQNGQKTYLLGRVFDTPVVAVGWEALPWVIPFVTLVLAALSGQRHPAWSPRKRLAAGVISMPLVLGSEWCHNLAHTAAAWAIHKPVSAIRILGGMPRLVYYEPDAEDIRPHQHLLRTVVGPLTNFIFWLITLLLHPFTPPDSLRREANEMCQGINALIGIFGLAPHPYFDGGPLLKWTLITRGIDPERAEKMILQANAIVGSGMVIGAAASLRVRQRNWVLTSMLGMMGLACLSFFFSRGKS